jgi:hypothetical protein
MTGLTGKREFPLKPEGDGYMALGYRPAGAMKGTSERHNSRRTRGDQSILTSQARATDDVDEWQRALLGQLHTCSLLPSLLGSLAEA